MNAIERPYNPAQAAPREIVPIGLGEWDAGSDTDAIPPRGWLLGTTFCRRYISCLMAAGGTGKTALRIAQALSLASGRSLTGEHVFQRARVLIVSLEDDRDELRRRVRAAMLYYGVTQEEIRGWLWLSTPAAMGWKLAASKDGGVETGELGTKLVETIKRRQIDLVMLDPLVKTHSVVENGNGDIDVVAGILAQIAASCDCAVDAAHHNSKGPADPGNADRGRGASSFKDAARLVYTLATMTEEEAKTFGVNEEKRRPLSGWIAPRSTWLRPRARRHGSTW